MSQQEQDEILGRTLRQIRETTRKLAALKSKADDYGIQLRTVVSALSPDATQIPTYDIERMPSSLDVLALLGEIRDTKVELDKLQARMREAEG